ncbi:Uncharacterized protein FWK35_00018491, partial [Aphis craccivora]
MYGCPKPVTVTDKSMEIYLCNINCLASYLSRRTKYTEECGIRIERKISAHRISLEKRKNSYAPSFITGCFHISTLNTIFLSGLHNSKRSDECIDFTMMFFLCIQYTTSRNNASISNFGGGFRWQKVKSKNFPIFKKKIDDGKKGIFTQNQFSTKSIFLYGCNSKTNHCKCLNFYHISNINKN